MKRFLTLLSLLIVAVCSFAQTFMVGDIGYSVLSSTDKTVQVSSGANATGDVVIPATVTYNGVEYRVATIGSQAFYQNANIISIDMPSVTSIGSSAFYGSSALTSVELPVVKSIGVTAFSYCTSLSSVSLPAATSINGYAFSFCSKISSLRIGSVEQWCNVNFSGNYSNPLQNTSQPVNLYIGDSDTPATEIVVPENVKTIPDYAFLNTTITSFSASGAETIGNSAFRNCTSLSSVSLPAATSIGGSAFYGCTSLSSVSLPAATSIGDYAFYTCSKISSLRIGSVEQWCKVNFDGSSANPLYSISQPVNLYIGDSETPATEIIVPSIVTKIPDNAFRRTTITSISALGAETIGINAFRDCTSLSSVSLPAATSIGINAFYDCTSLSSVSLPVATSIGRSAFTDCTSLSSVSLPAAESIGGSAFQGCTSLSSVSLPAATSIDNSAFYNCTSLSSVSLPVATSIGSSAFTYCTSLSSVSLPAAESIGDSAFQGCTSLSSVSLPAATSIGDYAFSNCTSLSSLLLSGSVSSIGNSAFTNCKGLFEIVFVGAAPTSVSEISCFDSKTSLVVPDAAYNDYVAAWPDYANQITIASQREREVTIVALDTESALHRALGEENLRHILRLKVSGSINGYDIMLLRNKMINLHYLDLSEATIEGNNYEYYTGYHTWNNEIGPYSFYNLPNLVSVKLPNVTAIGSYAFANCKNLNEINLPESLRTLSSYAFANCESLPAIEIPGSIKTIGSSAFYRCGNLRNVILHDGTETIGSYAFCGCYINEIRFPESLKEIASYAFSNFVNGNLFEEINLPPNLNTIGQYAFNHCVRLKVVRLNPMLKNISDNAFAECNALKKVYTYTLEPTDILQNTFSAYKTADLYVPTPSYYTYYYNTQWSQFLSVNKTDEEYDFKSFYINKDYVMDDDTGIIGGDPDAELNNNSGLVNNGSETQNLGTVTMRFNGNNGSASIIANGNLTADKIKVEITVTGNKWHFFCFPFDVPLSGVRTSGNKAYVFRHYNAAKRATGASGWEDLAADQTILKAGEGYIFQANGNTTLTVEVDNKTTFVGENIATALKVQDAANVANASWNFKGNPGYAYFDIDDLGFSAPITVWDPNTNNYVALRPGDDDAFLHPFQAFFVQKPEGTDALTFNAADRTTYLESQKAMTKKQNARRRAAASRANNPRKLINLNVSDGVNSDMTRVVFNDEKSMAYEIDCDAAKFNAAGVPQIYSIGADNTHFAINERPNDNGVVRLGFVADKAGIFTIEASRMDTPCCLKDLQTGVTYELKDGAYQFESTQGTFENRFLLINADAANGIETVEQESIPADAVIYDIQGRKVQRAEHGIFVVNGKKVNVK